VRGGAAARKDQIRASGKSYAEQSFAGASRFLDEYVGKWLGMYQETCEATHVRGEQSAEVLDLRMSCLQERLTGVRAPVPASENPHDQRCQRLRRGDRQTHQTTPTSQTRPSS
jgi:eukaryotic-like serine/threonine-protein kinase